MSKVILIILIKANANERKGVEKDESTKKHLFTICKIEKKNFLFFSIVYQN